MAVSVNVPASTTRVEPKSQHVSDSSIQPFLQADFDPVEYLNSTLPPLSASSSARNASNGQYGRAVALPELSSQLQSLLSQLNAQTSRLSNALTQLTDEIIRSGGRLAYEVEVLRGETIGFSESLENGLEEDIEVFTQTSGNQDVEGLVETGDAADAEKERQGEPNAEPEYLERLKTLTAVRARLDSVVKVFGEAMQWPLAPSELSMTSSLISVSAPDANDDTRSREEKGKAYTERLRSELTDLLGTGNDVSGLEAAVARLEELKRLVEVWKGTAEEKARLRLVESLQKLVDDRQKALEKSGRRPVPSPAREIDLRYGNMDSSNAIPDGGYGFLQNLRNLKNDVYLE